MTVGEKIILVDARGRPASRRQGGKPAGVRICYVRAWDDPEWRKANGLPEKKRGGARRRDV